MGASNIFLKSLQQVIFNCLYIAFGGHFHGSVSSANTSLSAITKLLSNLNTQEK